MPVDDGLGLHNEERQAPVGPDLREPNPEDAVMLAELRALSRMLQDGELVTEGYHLSGEFCPVTEKGQNQGDNDAEYQHVVLSEALKTCSDGPGKHTLDTRCKSIHTNADGILRRDRRISSRCLDIPSLFKLGMIGPSDRVVLWAVASHLPPCLLRRCELDVQSFQATR